MDCEVIVIDYCISFFDLMFSEDDDQNFLSHWSEMSVVGNYHIC